MSFQVKKIELKKISDDFKMGLKDYASLYDNSMTMKEILVGKYYETDILSGRTPSKFNPDYWDGDYDFITMADVDTMTYTLKRDIASQITDQAIAECGNLIRVPAGSLIISNAMTVGLSFLVDHDVYINQNVFWVKVNETKVNKVFLSWYFSEYMKKVFQSVYASKYLSKKELSRLSIPKIDIDTQNEISREISKISDKIRKEEQKLKTNIDMADEIISREFGYSPCIRRDLRKGLTFGTQTSMQKGFNSYRTKLTNFSEGKGVRFSARFLNPFFMEIAEHQKEQHYKKLSEVLLESTHRGTSPDYNPDGTVPVVKTAHLKNGEVLISEEEFVTEDFFLSHEGAQIRYNDILISSTGKPSIGKIDIVKTDEKLFADGHISIVRVNEELYVPEFLLIYLWSIYGNYQFEREFVGSTNQVEIYPEQIDDFLIPDVSTEVQKKIVEEMMEMIGKQKQVKSKITNYKDEISRLIGDMITDRTHH